MQLCPCCPPDVCLATHLATSEASSCWSDKKVKVVSLLEAAMTAPAVLQSTYRALSERVAYHKWLWLLGARDSSSSVDPSSDLSISLQVHRPGFEVAPDDWVEV